MLEKKIFYTEKIDNDGKAKCKEKYSKYPLYQIKSNFITNTQEVIINDIAFNIDKTRNEIYDFMYPIKFLKQK